MSPLTWPRRSCRTSVDRKPTKAGMWGQTCVSGCGAPEDGQGWAAACSPWPRWATCSVAMRTGAGRRRAQGVAAQAWERDSSQNEAQGSQNRTSQERSRDWPPGSSPSQGQCVHTHASLQSRLPCMHTQKCVHTHTHAHFSPDPPQTGGWVMSSAHMLLASSLLPRSPPFTVRSAGKSRPPFCPVSDREITGARKSLRSINAEKWHLSSWGWDAACFPPAESSLGHAPRTNCRALKNNCHPATLWKKLQTQALRSGQCFSKLRDFLKAAAWYPHHPERQGTGSEHHSCLPGYFLTVPLSLQSLVKITHGNKQ